MYECPLTIKSTQEEKKDARGFKVVNQKPKITKNSQKNQQGEPLQINLKYYLKHTTMENPIRNMKRTNMEQMAQTIMTKARRNLLT